jgi:hypothetical protein
MQECHLKVSLSQNHPNGVQELNSLRDVVPPKCVRYSHLSIGRRSVDLGAPEVIFRVIRTNHNLKKINIGYVLKIDYIR